MLEKERLLVALSGVPAGRVPGAPAVVLLVPGDRMIGAHAAVTVGRFVQPQEHLNLAARVGSEVVPLVGAVPALGQAGCGWMAAIFHLDGGSLNIRMAIEVCADELAVPWPVVLGVAG